MRAVKVWLVYLEYQADTPDVVGIYWSRDDAERTAKECRREARKHYGWVVYGDKDSEGNVIAEWNVDVHVEEHDVHPASSNMQEADGSVAGRYNHLYALGFSVDSDDPEGASAAEILEGIRLRLNELRSTGEALEAVGVPDETIDNYTGWPLKEREAFRRRRRRTLEEVAGQRVLELPGDRHRAFATWLT